MMMLLIRALSLLMSDMTMTTTMRMFDNIGSTLNNQEDTIVVITFFTARTYAGNTEAVLRYGTFS